MNLQKLSYSVFFPVCHYFHEVHVLRNCKIYLPNKWEEEYLQDINYNNIEKKTMLCCLPEGFLRNRKKAKIKQTNKQKVMFYFAKENHYTVKWNNELDLSV